MSETSKYPAGYREALNYPLFSALYNRRARRFGLGMEIPEGPTAYKSRHKPMPLSDLEECLLIAAGYGISGFCLGDGPFIPSPYGPGRDEKLEYHDGGATALMSVIGRTFPSSGATHGTVLFYSDDKGLFMVDLRGVRPEKMNMYREPDDMELQLSIIKEHTVKLSDARLDIPNVQPVMFASNMWSVNKPGATLFMSVTDLSVEYINFLLYFTADHGIYLIDDEKGGIPMCSEKWLASDFIKPAMAFPLSLTEHIMATATYSEGAFIGHNIALAAQAMGLGGFMFAGMNPLVLMGGTPMAHGLGFTYESSISGLPNPVGLPGRFEGHCPPYFKDMAAAVDDVVASKWGTGGLWTRSEPTSPYVNPAAIASKVPRPPAEVIQIVKEECQYVYEKYGQFPGMSNTMSMGLSVQVVHVDLDYYDTIYQTGAYSETQRRHMELWHKP